LSKQARSVFRVQCICSGVNIHSGRMPKVKRMMFIMYFECRACIGACARRGQLNHLSSRLSQEDQQLKDLVKEHGDKNWVLLTKVWSTTRSQLVRQRACVSCDILSAWIHHIVSAKLDVNKCNASVPSYACACIYCECRYVHAHAISPPRPMNICLCIYVHRYTFIIGANYSVLSYSRSHALGA
jgi:hypothetical protein